MHNYSAKEYPRHVTSNKKMMGILLPHWMIKKYTTDRPEVSSKIILGTSPPEKLDTQTKH